MTGALAISSTLGLIALFAPSGLGVREGVLVYFLSAIMPSSVAVILSILTRLWMTFIEIGLIGMVYLVGNIRRKKERIRTCQNVKDILPNKKRRPFPPSQGKDRSSLYRHLIAIGLIAGVAFLIYSNTFSVPFHFDDRPNITQNPNVQIKVLTWDRIEKLIYYTYKESIRIFSYFTLALNYYFGEFDVFGYHLVNLFIHVFAGIFLYGFLLLTFGLPSLKEKYGAVSYKVALFTSLIFISHPVQTQSVTYIVQRMTSLGGMFYLLTFVLYIKGRLATGTGTFPLLRGSRR